MNAKHVSYQTEIPEAFRAAAVELYDEAFGGKLSLAIPNTKERKQLFRKGFELNYAIGAFFEEDLLGVAGFHDAEGSLTGGITYSDLVKQLGFFKGSRAAIVFSLYDRKPEPGELVMDGISVRPDARGLGIGITLLSMIRQYAEENGHNRVRLDVIDTNPKAKKLYERMGFVAVQTESFPYLKNVLGFGGVTTMQLSI